MGFPVSPTISLKWQQGAVPKLWTGERHYDKDAGETVTTRWLVKWHKADADEKWLSVWPTRSLNVNLSRKHCLCCRKRQRLWERWTVPWVSWGFRSSIMWYFTVIQQEHVPASCFSETGLWKPRKWRLSTYSSVVVLWGEGEVSDRLTVILHISTLEVLLTGLLHVPLFRLPQTLTVGKYFYYHSVGTWTCSYHHSWC